MDNAPTESGGQSQLLIAVIVVGLLGVGAFGVWRANAPRMCDGIEEPPRPTVMRDATDQPSYGKWTCENGEWTIKSWGMLGDLTEVYDPKTGTRRVRR